MAGWIISVLIMNFVFINFCFTLHLDSGFVIASALFAVAGSLENLIRDDNWHNVE